MTSAIPVAGDAAPAAEAAPGERVVVLAPFGRDAAVLREVLGRAGSAAVVCNAAPELASCLQEGAGSLLLTEEALVPPVVAELAAQLAAQPTWSDLPMVLLAGAEPLAPESAQAIDAIRSAGNLTVLERPVRSLTLVTAVQAALRARRRQYQIRDLIEREHAAWQIAEVARQEAEAAAHVKDEFLAIVSHELRTPLSAIMLWSGLLARGHLDERKEQQALRALERSADAQSQLIEDLLDVSRMTVGKLHLSPRQTELSQLVWAAIDILRPAAEAKNIRIEAAISPHGGPVWVDPDRIQQVIWNLLSNAVKFTPPGGRVSIGLSRAEDSVRIEVADTGKGVSPQFLPYLFDLFRQADATSQRSQSGLGIGLAISRQLVELHGGTLRAESPGEGRGSVFTVELPLAPPPAATPPGWAGGAADRPKVPAAPMQSLRGVRVLLVEDDTCTREAMELALGQQGAEVTAVGSAGAALALLEKVDTAAGGPHLLLSDLAMPGMDGLELLRRLRAIEASRGDPALPAVLITAHARQEDRDRAMAAGFVAHIAKPIEREQLIALVARWALPHGAAVDDWLIIEH